ncbi:carboxypeptidase B-like [Ptychodera flava]|uniref:carboxypeptidase B-like n=1 Tax=Ptychodera flava TaxID=63121 RepID=UPI00396A1FD9
MFRVVLLSLYVAVGFAAKNYEGYKVLRMKSLSEGQVEALRLLLDEQELDFWNFPRDLMVPPSQLASVKEYLDAKNIDFHVWIEDVQLKIDSRFSGKPRTDEFDYSVYHTLDEIYEWIDSMLADYPNLASIVNIGKSYEGRDLTVLKMGVDTGKTKRNAWFNSLIHSREWVSGAACMYMANRLMSEYSTEPDIQHLLETYDVYYMPVVNPDGYLHTWDPDGDPMWRKTRSPNEGSSCLGTDGNRNYEYMWGGQGASPIPCFETYRGPGPFSEVETVAMADFFRSRPDDVFDIYLDYHAFGQMILSPWGYTADYPLDYATMDEAMKVMTDAIFDVHGMNYTYGASGPTLYPTSGDTIDWFYGDQNIIHSYTFEIRDEGEYGFFLPEDQIIPTGEENYAGFVALCLHIATP